MLSEILSTLQTDQGHFLDRVVDFATEAQEIFELADELPGDAAAQFAAGLLYGNSQGTIDKRDYIVGCTWGNYFRDRKLAKAFTKYNEGDIAKGNRAMDKAEPWWRLSMLTCWETNHYFRAMNKAKEAFLARDDYQEVAQANYEANKAYVDQQWANCLLTWNQGVYFNAGMFYGYVGAALMKTPEEMLTF